ncbi:MAG: VPLPA-CTERM sorting domain-containing protein [Desulfobulbaceae bacterium]|nr:VPLPA-CTERM sorting domain-containing protein [Desulfobulbaceae bacterium]
MKKKLWTGLAVGVMMLGMNGVAFADNIYVLKDSWDGGAGNYLANLGHSVTANTVSLNDYSVYDQVWDLRYLNPITTTDVTAFTNFLQGGGNMYLTGEFSPNFDIRNNSVETFVSGLGAGTLNFIGAVFGTQSITREGQIVNSPNTFAELTFSAASLGAGASITNGFLVTEYGNTGAGSLLGWDFKDISLATNARMLVGLDINFFANNGQKWTENMATYLSGDAPAPAPVPVPATMLLMGTGLAGLIVARRKKK